MNIFQRLNAVQKKVKYIQKDAQITGGGSYKAVTHDNVVARTRQHLVDAGVIIYPEQLKGDIIKEGKTKSGTATYLYSGSYAIHFVNIEDTNDRISVTIEAHAQDMSDKAPGKAVTYATKSALLKVLNLETGVNEESRVASSEPYSERQKETFDELLESGTPLEYLEFVTSLPEEGYAALQNSAEAGKKMKMKAACSDKAKEAHAILDDYANQAQEAIKADEPSVVMELIEELTDFEKKMVAARLNDEQIDWIKSHKEGE